MIAMLNAWERDTHNGIQVVGGKTGGFRRFWGVANGGWTKPPD